MIVKILTDKDSVIFDYCSNKEINKIPVFYSDGTLLGKYTLSAPRGSLILNFDPTQNRTFMARSSFDNNVSHYNNIAFYLEQSGANKEAITILEKIISQFPDRTVAYINLGDAYWGLGNQTKAREAYHTYVKQLKAAGKAQEIPQRVTERIK